MNDLYHYFLCPSSRFIRILLDEKKIESQHLIENFWNPSEKFLLMNPAGFFPVIKTKNGQLIVGAQVIMEYFEDNSPNPQFMKNVRKHEIRRMVHWFDSIFKNEVILPLLKEKILKVYQNSLPDSELIRIARSNLKYHMDYFNYLISNNDFFVNDTISYADFYYAASLSVLDYIDELNFYEFEKLKNLYLVIKSRPSFKKILKDRIIGINPSRNYHKIDY